jgi:hypothetical protein
MSSSNSSSNAATVRFDVGGTIYKVSRSLLEQHPNIVLARMVSKAWLGEKEEDDNNERKDDEPLFIDRDGERFRYVLDFMRDGPKVSLPVTISKEGFIKDLDYFGFDNVNPEDISLRSSHSVYVDMAKKMNTLEMTNIANGEMDRNCSVLAHYCFVRFKLSLDLVVNMVGHDRNQFYRSEHNKYQDNETMKKLKYYANQIPNDPVQAAGLNKYLNEYDLKLLNSELCSSGTIFYLEIPTLVLK